MSIPDLLGRFMPEPEEELPGGHCSRVFATWDRVLKVPFQGEELSSGFRASSHVPTQDDMTYEEFAAIALALPEVTEHVKRTEIDLSRAGRHMARLREKGRAVAIRLRWDMVDDCLENPGQTFFKTDHYARYPYVLAWLEHLEVAEATKLIEASWEIAPDPIPLRPN